jgi:hypothetical protein
VLNDVPAEKRLAYLLDLSGQRQRRVLSRRAVQRAVLGASALVGFLLWELLGH